MQKKDNSKENFRFAKNIFLEQNNNKKNIISNSDDLCEYSYNLFPELNKKNIVGIIGSDEVGTGDVFGPIVVCTALITKKQIPFLRKIGIKDSKKLSKNKIKKIYELIKDKILYQVQILTPSEYNLLNKTNNLNKIKALCHNLAIINILKKIKDKNVIVVMDQFASSSLYFNYLNKEKEIYKEIIFETKAESKYLSVTLASIIARYFFLQEIENISKMLGVEICLGADHKVNEQIIDIHNKHNFDIFLQISKCNFKNIKNNIIKNDK